MGRSTVLLPLLLCASPGFAVVQPLAPPPADHGQVPRFDEPIKVDGRLDESAWATALAIDLRYEVDPGENIPPPVRTVCLITRDRDRLFIGFRAYDPAPANIRAHYSDRDAAYRDDHVGIVIDAFHDGRRGFNFAVNPLGVQMDATITDLGGGVETTSVTGALAPLENFSWDAIWDAAGRITAEGYEVEIAIPFSSLRFPSDSGDQTWGVLPYRAWPRDAMHKLRATPRDRSRSCYFCQAGVVSGLSDMAPGRNLELDPTFTMTRTDQRADVPAGPLTEGSVDKELGLSARWGVTTNLSLNGAVNPDFSQVEADAAQLSINRQFALFYPEKRPFFLEGADFFQTPFSVFYSRTVADPGWGAKLTGKEGRNAVGLLVTRDRTTNLIFPGPLGSTSTLLEDSYTGGAVRWRRDIGEGSALGVLATDREGGDYHNRTYGVDGFLRLSSSDTLDFQALRTDTRYPDQVAAEYGQPKGGFSDSGLYAGYNHNTRDWGVQAYLIRRGRGFRADAGFEPQVGDRGVQGLVQRVFWADGKRWYNRLRAIGEFSHAEDESGQTLWSIYEATGTYDGPLQSVVHLHYSGGREFYGGQTFDTGGPGICFEMRPAGSFTASLYGSTRRAVDYDGVRGGRVLNLQPGVTFNLGRHLFAQLAHTFERFTLPEGWLYRANVTETRLVYQFNVRLFARAIIQRTVIDKRPELYEVAVEPREETWFGQYLLGYKINPQTVFFLGYSDNRVGDEVYNRVVQDRTFFLKLGYAWTM